MDRPNLKDVVDRERARIMGIKGVVGVAGGISPSNPSERCILVYARTSDWPENLPRQIDGYSVELVKTTGFRAF